DLVLLQGTDTVVSRSAVLSGQILTLFGIYDESANSFDLSEAYVPEESGTRFVWDPDGVSSLTVRGESHSLESCVVTPGEVRVDLDAVHDTVVLSARDGSAETKLLQREYKGVTRICYVRDPDFELVNVPGVRNALPALVAAAAADLARGESSNLRKAFA